MSLMRGQKGVLMLQSLIVQPIASWEIEWKILPKSYLELNLAIDHPTHIMLWAIYKDISIFIALKFTL